MPLVKDSMQELVLAWSSSETFAFEIGQKNVFDRTAPLPHLTSIVKELFVVAVNNMY